MPGEVDHPPAATARRVLRREDRDGHVELTLEHEVHQTRCAPGTLGEVRVEEDQPARGRCLATWLPPRLGPGRIEQTRGDSTGRHRRRLASVVTMGDDRGASLARGGCGAVGTAIVDDEDDVDPRDLPRCEDGPTDSFDLVLGGDDGGQAVGSPGLVGWGLQWVGHAVPSSINATR